MVAGIFEKSRRCLRARFLFGIILLNPLLQSSLRQLQPWPGRIQTGKMSVRPRGTSFPAGANRESCAKPYLDFVFPRQSDKANLSLKSSCSKNHLQLSLRDGRCTRYCCHAPASDFFHPQASASTRRGRRNRRSYFTSTVAPASANFFLMFSASSLVTPSLIVLGAPSTRSLASFKPRLVTSRTALMTSIFFAPTSFKMTLNSVWASAAGAAPAPAAAPPANATGAAAAADTPSRSSSFFTSCAASSSDKLTIESSICCRSAIVSLH